jgi:hypothetical protein
VVYLPVPVIRVTAILILAMIQRLNYNPQAPTQDTMIHAVLIFNNHGE